MRCRSRPCRLLLTDTNDKRTQCIVGTAAPLEGQEPVGGTRGIRQGGKGKDGPGEPLRVGSYGEPVFWEPEYSLVVFCMVFLTRLRLNLAQHAHRGSFVLSHPVRHSNRSRCCLAHRADAASGAAAQRALCAGRGTPLPASARSRPAPAPFHRR
jgi:hypothetical protein